MQYKGHKVFMDNGYPAIYLPSHPNCKQNGTVRIHILQAEEILGRYLQKNEVVHHCDENKENFRIENLWIFRSNNDHVSYHHAIKDGTDYILRRIKGVYQCEVTSSNVHEEFSSKCPTCGNLKTKNSKLCINCYSKSRYEHLPSKNELIKDIQEKSFLQIGKKYGVSDNAIRKWCKHYNLPFKYNAIKNMSQQDWDIYKE